MEILKVADPSLGRTQEADATMPGLNKLKKEEHINLAIRKGLNTDGRTAEQLRLDLRGWQVPSTVTQAVPSCSASRLTPMSTTSTDEWDMAT